MEPNPFEFELKCRVKAAYGSLPDSLRAFPAFTAGSAVVVVVFRWKAPGSPVGRLTACGGLAGGSGLGLSDSVGFNRES